MSRMIDHGGGFKIPQNPQVWVIAPSANGHQDHPARQLGAVLVSNPRLSATLITGGDDTRKIAWEGRLRVDTGAGHFAPDVDAAKVVEVLQHTIPPDVVVWHDVDEIPPGLVEGVKAIGYFDTVHLVQERGASRMAGFGVPVANATFGDGGPVTASEVATAAMPMAGRHGVAVSGPVGEAKLGLV